MSTITRLLPILLVFWYHIGQMDTVFTFPLNKSLAKRLVLTTVISGADWQLFSYKKVRIRKKKL